jgi:hypothetical protein
MVVDLDDDNSVLKTETVDVCDECVGEQWEVLDFSRLAELIAVVAMGQAAHVALVARRVTNTLAPIQQAQLRAAAVRNMTVPAGADPWRRDGFLFEAISWISAQQGALPGDVLRDPHIKATTQGLDGLLLRVNADVVERVVVFEDKCTSNPRKMFLEDVMPTFLDHHSGARLPELLAAIGELLKQTTISPAAIPAVAAKALEHEVRAYRASFAVGPDHKTQAARAALFKGYSDLTGIEQPQRLGATFVLEGAELREWFAKLADEVIAHLNQMGVEDV